MVVLQKIDVRKQVGREAFLVEPCLTLDPCTAIIVVYWEVVDHILADPPVLCNLYDTLKPLDS